MSHLTTPLMTNSKRSPHRSRLAAAGGSVLTGLDGHRINARATHKNERNSKQSSSVSKNRNAIYVKGQRGAYVNRDMDDVNTEVRSSLYTGSSDCVIFFMRVRLFYFTLRTCLTRGPVFL